MEVTLLKHTKLPEEACHKINQFLRGTHRTAAMIKELTFTRDDINDCFTVAGPTLRCCDPATHPFYGGTGPLRIFALKQLIARRLANARTSEDRWWAVQIGGIQMSFRYDEITGEPLPFDDSESSDDESDESVDMSAGGSIGSIDREF